MLAPIGLARAFDGRRAAVERVDLRRWCSPVLYQGPYETCGCHVVTGLVDVLELRARRPLVPLSRLFLHQVAKRLADGDAAESDPGGVYLRQLFGALALLGAPPERYWPYLDVRKESDPRLTLEPDAFCFALARRFEALRCFRVDTPDAAPRSHRVEPTEFLRRMRHTLAVGLPCSLGFPLYRQLLSKAAESGAIAAPTARDELVGNHAVLIVGFDDAKEIAPAHRGTAASRGALLFKNSWGAEWGEAGYGWLPYDYVLRGLASDCWSLLAMEWVDAGAFDLPLAASAAVKG